MHQLETLIQVIPPSDFTASLPNAAQFPCLNPQYLLVHYPHLPLNHTFPSGDLLLLCIVTPSPILPYILQPIPLIMALDRKVQTPLLVLPCFTSLHKAALDSSIIRKNLHAHPFIVSLFRPRGLHPMARRHWDILFSNFC